MTNKEILQASMLDILFEHRNKLYGAYALRKSYSNRLGLSLVIALSTVLLFLLMSFIKRSGDDNSNPKKDDSYKLTQLVIPEEPKEPDKQKVLPKPQTAEVDYQKIVVVPDKDADSVLPTKDDIDRANIGDKNRAGEKPDALADTTSRSNGSGKTTGTEPEKEPEPDLPSRQPSFPGGPAKWLEFLQRYLQAPESLEPGQRIEVQVRFWVDVDGSVSKAEIIKSGGSSFDKEVLRVMKKMPRWEPAMQKGKYVAVAYQQPVTFLGVEE